MGDFVTATCHSSSSSPPSLSLRSSSSSHIQYGVRMGDLITVHVTRIPLPPPLPPLPPPLPPSSSSSSSLTTVRCLFRPRSVALLMSANKSPSTSFWPSACRHGRLPSYHGNRHRPCRRSIPPQCRFIICHRLEWEAGAHGAGRRGERHTVVGAVARRRRSNSPSDPPCETSSTLSSQPQRLSDDCETHVSVRRAEPTGLVRLCACVKGGV